MLLVMNFLVPHFSLGMKKTPGDKVKGGGEAWTATGSGRKKAPGGDAGGQKTFRGRLILKLYVSSGSAAPAAPPGRSPNKKPRAGRGRGAGVLPVNRFSFLSFSSSPGPPGPAGRYPGAGRWGGWGL